MGVFFVGVVILLEDLRGELYFDNLVFFECLSVMVDDLEWDGEMLEYNVDNCFFQVQRLFWDLYNCNGGILS